MKNCPFCGASLPEEASFCPFCEKSVNSRTEAKPPHHYIFRKLLRIALPLILIILLAAGLCHYLLPKTFEGAGEVIYTDADGSYQLLTNHSLDRHTPLPELDTAAGAEERYRFPSYLYINHMESGADAGEVFMKKVDSVSVTVLQPETSPSPIQWSEPEAMKDVNPDAILVTLVDFTRESETPADILWTLHMKNGDTIRLSMRLVVTPTTIYDYSPENADMSDTAALQALLDQAAAIAGEQDTINVYLPPITYTEQLVIPEHAFNLFGSEAEGQRTTFTEGIRMENPKRFFISYFTGIDFKGDGTGIGLSTAGRVWTRECSFSNWRTALLGYGNVWVNTTDCMFEHNGIGFHFNSIDPNFTASDTHFTGNSFTGNDTAVFLEEVPTDVKMNFSGCVFTDNGVDIDNPCQQPVDITEAIFQ